MSKQPAGTNGVTWRAVVGVLLTLCGFLAMGTASYLKGEVNGLSERIEGHSDRDGHPVIVERVNFMRRDIEEIKIEQRQIKAGVNELLRRIPQ